MTETIRDFSIDIEAFGVNPGAAILSIGCVQFDRNTGKTGAEFYVEIDHVASLRCGEVDASTMHWWVKENPEVLAKLLEPKPEKMSVATALDTFGKWMRTAAAGIPVIKGNLGGGTPYVWGNGATMDISVLEHMFRHGGYGLTIPWHFRHIRDMRTIMDAARHRLGDAEWQPKLPEVLPKHHALSDAKFQARAIAEAFHVVKTGKPRSAAPAPATTEDDDL
jgi:hypothetical protein